MALIKSALELALERTADIQGDKMAIDAKNETDAGRRHAFHYLDNEIDLESFEQEIKKREPERLRCFIEGCFKTFLANLVLPVDENFTTRLDAVRAGMLVIIPQKQQITTMFEQISQFFSQYLQNKKQMEDQLSAQYEPQLRHKEQELSRQMGYAVSLSPMQDPEFVQALQKHIGQLDKQYNDVLSQAKDQMSQMLE